MSAGEANKNKGKTIKSHKKISCTKNLNDHKELLKGSAEKIIKLAVKSHKVI